MRKEARTVPSTWTAQAPLAGVIADGYCVLDVSSAVVATWTYAALVVALLKNEADRTIRGEGN